MTEHVPDFNDATAMRAQGEADRTPGFKAAREEFVVSVNGWLKVIADFRDTGQPLPDGRVISSQPRIKITDLGRVRAGRANAVEYQPGVSLTGDGVETPLVLQSVAALDGRSDVIVVTGSDPLAQSVYGDYGFSRQQEVTAQVTYRTAYADGSVSEGETTAYGDGRVQSRFIHPTTGVNTSRPLSGAAEMQQATVASQSIIRDIA